MVLTFFLVLWITDYSLFRRIHFWITDLAPIGDFRNKVLYVDPVKDSYDYPPYGDIVIGDIESGSARRISFDDFYDASPSYSSINNVIYFESKRTCDEGVKPERIPSDLYKYDIKNKEILRARADVAFALKYDNSEIVSPLVSPLNDSLIAFLERPDTAQRLVVANFIRRTVLADIPLEAYNDIAIRDFMDRYVVMYDADGSRGRKVGIYFANLETQEISYVPDKFKYGFYYVGSRANGSDDYYIVYEKYDRLARIYRYNVVTQDTTFVMKTPVGRNTSIDMVVNDTLAVVWYSGRGERAVFRSHGGEREIFSFSRYPGDVRFYFD